MRFSYWVLCFCRLLCWDYLNTRKLDVDFTKCQYWRVSLLVTYFSLCSSCQAREFVLIWYMEKWRLQIISVANVMLFSKTDQVLCVITHVTSCLWRAKFIYVTTTYMFFLETHLNVILQSSKKMCISFCVSTVTIYTFLLSYMIPTSYI
jgi:hypothetical protein